MAETLTEARRLVLNDVKLAKTQSDFSIFLNAAAFKYYPNSVGWGPYVMVLLRLFHFFFINECAPAHSLAVW